MATKNIQLSTRVTEDDAAFLARVEVEGAQTPSDKIRALIGEARRRHEARRDYRSALQRAGELVGPIGQDIRTAEHATGMHSELVRLVADWVPETLAFLMSAIPGDERRREEALRTAERGLADRTLRLVESILRLGVTGSAPCYDAAAISDRLEPVLSLLEVLRAGRNAGRGATHTAPGGGTT